MNQAQNQKVMNINMNLGLLQELREEQLLFRTLFMK